MTRFLLVAALLIAPIYQAEGQATFDVGDRVQVGDPEGTNVRESPAGPLIGTQPLDAQGTVVDGLSLLESTI
jgi:hypothetical protein